MEKKLALETLKSFVKNTDNVIAKDAILALHPELAESKDERIRNLIYCLIRDRRDNRILLEQNGVSVDDALTYLEKMKEPLTPEEKMKHPLYVEGFETGKQVGAQYEAVFEKQKEQKTIEMEVYEVGKGTTICGQDYKCKKDYQAGNCWYIKDAIYHCSRDGYLNDQNGVSWSCTPEWFNEYIYTNNELAEKEKNDFVSGQFLQCKFSFDGFKEGEHYWLEYIGDDMYVGRSDNILNQKFHITPRQLYTLFSQKLEEVQGPPQEEKQASLTYEPPFNENPSDKEIIEALIRHLKEQDGFLTAINCVSTKAILSWLKKQKENSEYVFRPLAGTDINTAVLQAIRRANEGDRLVLAFNGAYIPVRKGCNANEIVDIYDAFIDKQEEQKPTEKIEPKFKVGDKVYAISNRFECTIEGIDETTYYGDATNFDIKDQDEWKLVSELEQNPAESELDELKRLRNLTHEIRAAYERGIKVGRDEVKPAEWSEEDEKFFKTALLHIRHSISNDLCETMDWLKGVRERIKKLVWSEEDERMLSRCVKSVECSKEFCDTETFKDAKDVEKDWLKNLPERFNSMPKQECSEDESFDGSKKTTDNDEICETSQDYLNGFECGKQYVLKYPEKFNLSIEKTTGTIHLLPKTE